MTASYGMARNLFLTLRCYLLRDQRQRSFELDHVIYLLYYISSKRCFDCIGKIEGKTRQNAENKQTFDLA